MPFTSASPATIYWKLEGSDSGSPLVLLNSIGTDMDLWDGALHDLRRNHLLLRIDTRGHGASSAPPGDYSLEGLAQDILAVMDDAGMNRADIAGVSLGGMMAMQMALQAPERVRRIALICTSATMDRAAWQARIDTISEQGMEGIADLAIARFLSDETVRNQPAMTATLRKALLRMTVDGYRGCAAAIRDMAIDGRLNQIAAPTLVITGSKDASTPFEGHGEHLLSSIPDAQHASLAAAHLAPIEAPTDLASTLEHFFLNGDHA